MRSRSPDLVIASCIEVMAETEQDDLDLVSGLETVGIRAAVWAWDDVAAHWHHARAVILRSTWNYHLASEHYLQWVSNIAKRARLWNDLSIVEWNINKTYLQQLKYSGVPIVPTARVKASAPVTLAVVADSIGAVDLVVKPVIGADSYLVRRCTPDPAGETHLRAVLAHTDALVQPYQSNVERYGERSVIWIDGVVTHAVRKSPHFHGDKWESAQLVSATDDEMAVAVRAIAALPRTPLYGRVDLIRGADGRSLVSEVEAIDPSLHLTSAPWARDRLVTALARLLC